MTTWLIHGVNVRDGGDGSIGKLQPHLSGDVKMYSYGWTGLLTLACSNRKALNKLLDIVKPGDFLILHSNAALIGWQLADVMGDQLGGVVCINPALRRDAIWPDNLPVLCLANKTDWVVSLGRVWGRLFPFDGVKAQGWGAAGRYGFTSGQESVWNWFTNESWWLKPVTGHSGLFDHPEYWAHLLNKWIEQTKKTLPEKEGTRQGLDKYRNG